MVTFAEVSTFLKEHGNPQIAGQVEAFFRHLRTGKCFLDPFDNDGDHEYYFTSSEMSIAHLFVVGYKARGDTVDVKTSFLCFDGEQLDLTDAYALLGRFLQYEQRFLEEHEIDEPVELDLPSKLADGKWLWTAFMICEDHEGSTAMAAYSKTLTPAEGLVLLHTAIKHRLLGDHDSSDD